MKKYFTTPIYYVNDIPHIGHAYNILATDTLTRFWRKKIGRENVFFLTGTDENSQKTVEAAHKAQKPVCEYLEEMAKNWKSTWQQIGIDFDGFIRTTEARHIKVVQEILQKIYDNGDVYKGEYKGIYCTGCESFLKETDLDAEGNCPDHKRKPTELSEENYFFRLSKYTDQLLELFDQNLLIPEKRKNEMMGFIKNGLEDVSISRESAEIGIPFPFDPNHKVYVWVDALINYRSACPHEAFWDDVLHVIGKDITKFHTLIWPAMLISAGIKPPKQVFAHGFFTVNGTKMSKTLGNVIDPLVLGQNYGNDALRCGLLSSFEFGNDGDFSMDNFAQFYNAKLAGGVGNLFNRVIILISKNFENQKPTHSLVEVKTTTEWQKFSGFLENMQIKAAIDYFFEVVDTTNQLMNEKEIWKLVKTDTKEAKEVFAILLQKLEILAEIAKIILPESAIRMKKMLGDDQKVGNAEILFERREDPKKEESKKPEITPKEQQKLDEEILEKLDNRIVIGKILEIRPHSNPEITKVRVTQCDIGDGKIEQILCGGTNIEIGKIVPIATIGADLGNGFIIGEREIRGEVSRGMICARTELGILPQGEKKGEIWILDPELEEKLGTPICELYAIQIKS